MHSASKTTLRLATWNIRAGLGTDLRRDAGRVIDGIAALDADIVALQEADFRFGARPSALPRELVALHAVLVPLPVGTNAASFGWHGNTVLVKPGILAQPMPMACQRTGLSAWFGWNDLNQCHFCACG